MMEASRRTFLGAASIAGATTALEAMRSKTPARTRLVAQNGLVLQLENGNTLLVS